MLTDRIKLFLLGTVALLLLLGLGALLWRRFYREDPHNTARRVVKNSAIPLALRLVVRALDLLFAFVNIVGADGQKRDLSVQLAARPNVADRQQP